MTEEERQERLAYALTEIMRRKGMSARALARAMGKDPATVNRWAKGQAAPSILVARDLADALGVRVELLIDPPAIPEYPLSEYLLREAAESGIDEGLRRDRQRLVAEDPTPLRPSKPRSPRGSGAGRG